VVLHGGAMAVFRVPSLAAAARLAEAVAGISGLDDALMTLSDGQLTVRLTRAIFRLEERHVELARAVSAVAREHGATADRSLAQETELAIAVQPDATDVGFWRAVLGYAELDDDNAVDPLGHGSTVWIQSLDPAKSLRHAMHVDVSVAREQAEQRLAAALAAGASSTIPTPQTPGSSPTAPATVSASRPGRMAPPARPGGVRQVRPGGGRAAGMGRRRSHCHSVRRGGHAFKPPASKVPETSIRNLTGTPAPHGARTFTPLALTARSSVFTTMPGLVSSRRLPPRTATSSWSDGHEVTASVKSSVTLPLVTSTCMRRGTIHGPCRRVLEAWHSMRTRSFGLVPGPAAGDAGRSDTSAASSP
jgi:4a-hydroxytetrahydrobiopterin dehydratase